MNLVQISPPIAIVFVICTNFPLSCKFWIFLNKKILNSNIIVMSNLRMIVIEVIVDSHLNN